MTAQAKLAETDIKRTKQGEKNPFRTVRKAEDAVGKLGEATCRATEDEANQRKNFVQVVGDTGHCSGSLPAM